MRHWFVLTMLLTLVLCGAPVGAFAQATAPGAPAAGPDDEVARRAGTFRLLSADGIRGCDVVLRTAPAGPGFAIDFDRAACAPIVFSQQVAAWRPEAFGAIRLLGPRGDVVVEFTEGAEGSYEALREGDGVYFLEPPDTGTPLGPEQMVGAWEIAGADGRPLCRWTLTDAPVPAPEGARRVETGAGCPADVARLAPSSWWISDGDLLLRSASRAGVMRFVRREDGTWVRMPDEGLPLVMTLR